MRNLLAALALSAATLAGPVRIPEVIDLQNGKDPVNGKPVVEGQQLDWHGARIRFFGSQSIEAFRKEPAKYLAALKVKLDGKVLSLQNKTCPVTGKPAGREHFHDRNGVRVHLASAAAGEAIAKEPAKYFSKLGYRYVPSVVDLQNETCPVTGDRCYPEAPIWVEVEGIRIRVCCDHCVKEVEDDPKRTFQAMMVDPEKMKKSVK